MLAASGVSDAVGLSSQLGVIAADASAAAAKKLAGDDDGAEQAESLQRKHAEVMERFDVLISGYGASLSAEACLNVADAPVGARRLTCTRASCAPAEQESGAGGAGGHEGVAGCAGSGA